MRRIKILYQRKTHSFIDWKKTTISESSHLCQSDGGCSGQDPNVNEDVRQIHQNQKSDAKYQSTPWLQNFIFTIEIMMGFKVWILQPLRGTSIVYKTSSSTTSKAMMVTMKIVMRMLKAVMMLMMKILKGSYQKIFYRPNLTFWKVMACGKAYFGRKGQKNT